MVTYVGETTNDIFDTLPSTGTDYANEESEVRTQIIHKTSDSRFRCKALRKELDLEALLAYGLALEQSNRHSKLLEEHNKGNHCDQTWA